MKTLCIGGLIWMAACAAASAMDSGRTFELLGSEDHARQVLTNRYIYIASTNTVHADFDRIMSILHSEDILTTIQAGYDAVLEPGEKKEWTITKTGDQQYWFVNRKGETSEIFELYRSPASGDFFEVAVLSQGKRFFGYYQALVHIQVEPDAERHCAYRADIYAYPRNGLVRFIARNLHLVERFFNKKTDQIIEISTRVSLYLCAESEMAALK